MSVFKKLQDARIQLQNMKLEKTGENKFAGYKYFELGDFLPATQKIFSDIGLCGVASFTAELATLRVVDIESGNEILFTSPMGSAHLKGCHEVQNIGAVETYQRRYLWVTAMEIVEHDALDPLNGKPLTSEDMDNILLSMRESIDINDLKNIYLSVSNGANEQQKKILSAEASKRKKELMEKK